MFDDIVNSISSGLGNLWNSGSSAVSSGFNNIENSLFGELGSSNSLFSSNPFDFSSMSPFTSLGSIFGFGGSNDIYNPSSSIFGMGGLFGGFSSFNPFSMFGASMGASGNTSSSSSSSATGDYADIINKAAEKYGVDAKLIQSIMQTESSGDPNATSSCGAQGLMQMMPETFASTGYTDAYDPEQNIMAGASHIKSLMEHFDGDIEKVIAAYNAGAGAVDKYGGTPPYEETQNYVQKVLGYYNG